MSVFKAGQFEHFQKRLYFQILNRPVWAHSPKQGWLRHLFHLFHDFGSKESDEICDLSMNSMFEVGSPLVSNLVQMI